MSAAQGCSFQMRCGIADSPGCPVVVESEAHSTFAAQDLTVRDRAAVMALAWRHCSSIVLVIPLELWWIDFWQVQRITALLLLTSCRLHTMVLVLSQHHQLVVGGELAGVTFVGEC